MVATTSPAAECADWRDALRASREQFTACQSRLLDIVSKQSSREVLLEIEHLHNQCHIQLINIHDLRHAIKRHSERIASEQAKSSLSDETLARHEMLRGEYRRLRSTLSAIAAEFDQFFAWVGRETIA